MANFLNSLFLVLMDMRIPFVIQGFLFSRNFFLDIVRNGACLSIVDLNVAPVS